MTDRFSEARAQLAKHIGTDGVAVVPASSAVVRSHDVEFDFHQDPDFLYLTGFNEPDAVAVLAPGHAEGEYALFVRPKDREQEVWTGYRAGVEGAVENHGADVAFDIAEPDDVMRRYLAGREVLWYAVGNPGYDSRITRLFERSRTTRYRMGSMVPSSIKDISTVLHEMRLLKTPEEQQLLIDACNHAHRLKTLRGLTPCEFIRQVWANEPDRFRLDPSHHIPEPCSWSAKAQPHGLVVPANSAVASHESDPGPALAFSTAKLSA